MTRRVSLSVLFAGLLVAACASAPGVPEQLDAGDVTAMTATLQAALEGNRVGESANWSNPANGHLGTITPIRTYDDETPPCRDYQLTATVGGETEIGYDTACRRADGVWVSRDFDGPVEVLKYARADRRRDRYYDDPWCDWPRGRYDPWCRPRSGVSVGVGVGF